MLFDDLYKKYDGFIPPEEKTNAFHGSREAYYLHFLTCAEKQFTARCLHAVRAGAAWRVIDRYTQDIQEAMLTRMQKILRHSRDTAVDIIRSRPIYPVSR